jgi:organic radical activating enzyme
MKEIPSKTFCSMAWNHQFIDPTGRIKPCCRFVETHRPKENNLVEKTLSEVFFGEWMNDVRSKMLAGEEVAGCMRCYQEEAAGKKSLRERYHENKELPIEELVDKENPNIRWIELAISNDCNLACRMCDSRYAWKWFKEEKELYGETQNKFERTKSDISNIYPFIKDLVHVKFTGGEPLITHDQWKLLDKLLDERDCSKIFLDYSTNCTIMPKDNWVEKWSKFKKVEFSLSFDSANPYESEYIRWPATYETTESVTKKFLELKKTHNFHVSLRSTISILNIWHFPESMQWWYDNDPGPYKSMNPTHLTFPENLCVTVLPEHIKKRITEKFNSYQKTCKVEKINNSLEYIKNFMNSKDNSHLLPSLKFYLEGTDKFRGQDFFKSYPQFFDIFK